MVVLFDTKSKLIIRRGVLGVRPSRKYIYLVCRSDMTKATQSSICPKISVINLFIYSIDIWTLTPQAWVPGLGTQF